MTLASLIDSHDLDVLCDLAAASPQGCIIELGVYQGGSAQRLYDVCEKQGRTLHLFDTFAGHPIVTAHDTPTHHQGRYSDAITPDALQALLPNAVLHVGTFPDTLPPDLSDIALVHSDADLYAPTKAVCTLLPPRMVQGGMLYFDDYGRTECPGVERAITETFGAHAARVLGNGKALVTIQQAR
jgi:hypothetical protein